MRIIVSLLLVFAVLCALLVLEVRHGTLASIVNLFDDRSLPYREPGPYQPDDGPACLKRLDAMDGIEIRALDPFVNNQGCGTRYPVLLQSVDGIDIEGKGLTLSCPAAERFARWIKKDVIDLVAKYDKGPVSRLSHMGSYNCRKIGGSSLWSQHAFANAVDFEGLVFEDGSAITIKQHWDTEPILEDLARSACDDFNVVLSPNYNDAHHDHLHFDLGPLRVCR